MQPFRRQDEYEYATGITQKGNEDEQGSWSKDGVKLPSPCYNYWEKWAVCNYHDIKPNNFVGPEFFLVYTAMNQETVRGDLGQGEFFR